MPPQPDHIEQVLVPPLREDLLTDATRRLVLVAMLCTVAAGGGLVVSLINLASESGTHAWIRVGAAAWIVTLSGSVAVALRGRKVSPRQMRLTGTAFLLVLAVAGGLVRHLVSQGEALVGGTPGIAVAVMIFPVLVPGTPRRAALNGLMVLAVDVAAYTTLVGVALVPAAAPWAWPGLFRGDVLAIVVAYGLAHIVSSLEERVVTAGTMGAYTLQRKLGAGAMGEVWVAEHALLVRPAAVKLIRASASDDPFARDAMTERFEREVQATAALRCPHTIDIYDFGVAPDGRLYYVMELLDGADLQTLVEHDGPLAAPRAVHLLRQICASLAEAHERGLVHRDIKPANIFVCTYGRETDFVKVLDFGLVKVAEPEKAGLTVVGAITGTPAYMAPEQTIDGRDVDARTDIYAVAVLAYFMFTGQLIFGDLPPATYLAAHRKRAHVPLAEAGVEVPARLQALLDACLAKDRDNRPTDMDAVAAELEAIAETLPPWPPRPH